MTHALVRTCGDTNERCASQGAVCTRVRAEAAISGRGRWRDKKTWEKKKSDSGRRVATWRAGDWRAFGRRSLPQTLPLPAEKADTPLPRPAGVCVCDWESLRSV